MKGILLLETPSCINSGLRFDACYLFQYSIVFCLFRISNSRERSIVTKYRCINSKQA